MSNENEIVILEIQKRFEGNFFIDGDLTKPTDKYLAAVNAIRANIDNYSEKDHFIYELIQNAEDCGSNEFKMIIEKDRIIAVNDGHPFSEDEVKSISSFGEGTKREKDEYIGFFGAGFKSVFRITDMPHIFSGNFRFKFDSNTFHIPTVSKLINPFPSKGSTILLHFKKDISSSELESIRTQITTLSPEIVLFLKNLNKVHIIDNVTKNEFTYSKKQKDEFVELFNNKTKAGKWLVFQEKFNIPKEALNSLDKKKREKRSQTNLREVSLAFKLGEGNDFLTLKDMSSLFAFLPIKKYSTGLKFIINSDFITPPTRELIYEEIEWNRWLFRCAFDVLKQKAIPYFQGHKDLKYSFYQILPTKYEINSFLQQFYDSLEEFFNRERIFIDYNGDWKYLNEILYFKSNDFELFDFIDYKVFNNLTLKFALNQKIKGIEFLKHIGLNDFELDKYLYIFEKVSWFKDNPLEFLLKLYTYFSKVYGENAVREKIIPLKIFKLNSGEFISIDEIKERFISKCIYFPLKEKNSTLAEQITNIGFLDAKIYELYLLKYQRLGQFFKYSLRNDIKEFDINAIVLDYLLPKFENPSKYSDKELIDDTINIMDSFNRLNDDTKREIKEKLLLRTKTGRWIKPNSVYFSKEYIGDDLFDDLSDNFEMQVLSTDYIKKVSDTDSMKKFFTDLSVNSYFKVEEVGRFRDGVDHGRDSVSCKILNIIFNKLGKFDDTKKIKLAKKIFKNIDDNWNYYQDKLIKKEYKEKIVMGVVDDIESQEFPTEFLSMLRNRSWVPNTTDQLLKPDEVYLDKDSIKKYNVNLPRINLDYQLRRKELIVVLGLKERLDAITYISDLISLKNKKDKLNLIDCDSLYSEIGNSIGSDYSQKKLDEIKQKFEENKLMFLPSKLCPLWLAPSECFLYADSLIKDYIPGLNNLYHEKGSAKLFSDHLKIREQPTVENYLDAIRLLQHVTITKRMQEDILKIYGLINSELKKTEEVPEWWIRFKDGDYLLSNRDRGKLCNRNVLFFNDNYEIAALFENEIDFLYIPTLTYLPEIRVLLDKLNLKRVGNETKQSIIESEVISKINIIEYLRDIEMYDKGIREYISKHYNENNGVIKDVRSLKIFFVNEINITLSLNGISKTESFKEYLDSQDSIIYLLYDKKGDNVNFYKNQLAKTLAQFYGIPNLSEHIFRLIQSCIIDKEGIIEFYKRAGIQLTTEVFDLSPIQRGIIIDKMQSTNNLESKESITSDGLSKTYADLEIPAENGEQLGVPNVASGADGSQDEEPKAYSGESVETKYKAKETESPKPNEGPLRKAQSMGREGEISELGVYKLDSTMSLEEEKQFLSKVYAELDEKEKERFQFYRYRQRILTLEKPQVDMINKEDLDLMYFGLCQICQNKDSSFLVPGSANRLFFIMTTIYKFSKGGLDHVANKLCLCPKHHWALRSASVDYFNWKKINEKERTVQIIINDKNEYIHFDKTHFKMFKLLKEKY